MFLQMLYCVLYVAWRSLRVQIGCINFLKFCSFSVCVLPQQMKKEYGSNVVPAFPPKKIFTLTPAEVEQRREQLEKYMQAGKLFMLNGPLTDGLYCLLLCFSLNAALHRSKSLQFTYPLLLPFFSMAVLKPQKGGKWYQKELYKL